MYELQRGDVFNHVNRFGSGVVRSSKLEGRSKRLTIQRSCHDDGDDRNGDAERGHPGEMAFFADVDLISGPHVELVDRQSIGEGRLGVLPVPNDLGAATNGDSPEVGVSTWTAGLP